MTPIAVAADAKPYAYIRKSTKGGQDSKTDQIAGARELAQRNGIDPDSLVILTGDWGISASREKRQKRLDFARLVEDVEAGRVSALFATDADRLARDREVAIRLGNACEDAGVLIHTPVKSFDMSDPGDRMIWTFAAMQNEEAVRTMSRKAQARVARQTERGERLGQRPYGMLEGEDVGVVVAAFREAGSFHGACRLLTARGIRSRRSHLPSQRDGIVSGQQGWSATTVRKIITRTHPELLPVRKEQRARTRSDHTFARMLICPHDSNRMTSMPRKDASTAYLCRQGHKDPDCSHPRPYVVAERGLLAWAKRETAGVLRHSLHVVGADGAVADLEALQTRKERAGTAFAMGAMSEPDFRELVANVDEESARLLAAQRASVTFHAGLDWSQPVADLNARLRELWWGIRLGYVPSNTHVVRGRHSRDHDLVPIGAIWTVEPEGFEHVERVEGGWFLPSREARWTDDEAIA